MSPLDIRLGGAQLIEASAGAGKTHAITTLFLRLLLEKGLPVRRILVVTYTNAATAEIRERIRSRIAAASLACGRPDSLAESDADLRALLAGRIRSASQDRHALEAALHGFDEAAISTIHGFCQRVLQEQAFETRASFAGELLADGRALRDEIVHDLWVRALVSADEMFLRHLEAKGVRPSSLASLVGKALADTDLRLLPVEAPPADGTVLSAWQQARDAAREEWRRDHREIRRALESPSLKQTTYRVDRVRSWLEEVESALAASPPLSAQFPWLERLTPSALAKGTKARHPTPDRPFFALCERLWRLDLAIVVDLDRRLVRLERSLCLDARREAAERKRRRNCVSFEDLLVGVRDALRAEGGERLAERIRQRHAAALIDEFQDTDPIQYQIFDRIWRRAGAPLFLVGDPKQAIYAFRGADVHTYLRAKQDAEERHPLTVNYRSDPGLIGALNCFFGETADPFAMAGIDYTPVVSAPGRADALDGASELNAPLRILFFAGPEVRGPRGRIVKEKSDAHLPGAIAAEVVRLLEAELEIPDVRGGGRRMVGPGDVAVLCRTNAEARQVQAALQRLGVPAVLRGDRSVFESEEAKDLRALLRAMADPTDPRLVRAALATALVGMSATRLVQAAGDDERWDGTVARFTELRDQWTGAGFMRAFRLFLDADFEGAGKVVVRLRSLPGGERRLTNLLHLGELLHEAAMHGHRGPYEMIDWLGREIDEAVRLKGGLAPEERQIRLESDARSVTLTTIHKAKGLEWPFVFCPYLWAPSVLWDDERKHVSFHDAEGQRALDLGSAEHDAAVEQALEERKAEDLRLLYVALTRARHQCSIVWGGFKDGEASPLGRFLAHGVDLDDDEAIVQHLERLRARSAGRIAVRRLSLVPSPVYRAARPAVGGLDPRSFRRGKLDVSWRTSSFTALAASEAHLGTARTEGRDRDEIASEPGAAGFAPLAQRLPLADFPAGARAGSLVHEIFERIDLARVDPDELGRVVDGRLRAFGFDPRWKDPLALAIAGVLDARLRVGGLAVRLAGVPAEKRVHEMEFTLPLGSPRDPARLTPAALAAAFERHPSPELPSDYGSRLRGLGFAEVAGFLRGYVDLVFEHSGRFFLVDWKSNHLGAAARDYRPAALARAMAADHYFLQYHLYLAALHRHLAARLPGYRYETHFGGVFYVFVRGVVTGTGDGAGIFADRPPAERIEALSRLLEQPTGEAVA